MNLRLLAPDIQEELLFLPETNVGNSPFQLKEFQTIATDANWHSQRKSRHAKHSDNQL